MGPSTLSRVNFETWSWQPLSFGRLVRCKQLASRCEFLLLLGALLLSGWIAWAFLGRVTVYVLSAKPGSKPSMRCFRRRAHGRKGHRLQARARTFRTSGGGPGGTRGETAAIGARGRKSTVAAAEKQLAAQGESSEGDSMLKAALEMDLLRPIDMDRLDAIADSVAELSADSVAELSADSVAELSADSVAELSAGFRG